MKRRFNPRIAACIALGSAWAVSLVPAYAEDNVSVRLNWFATGYSAPFYLGVDKGWYRDVGINLTVQEGQGNKTAQQVAAGGSDFGFINAEILVSVVAQGAPVKMVASVNSDVGYCTLVRADSGINSFKDLEGKRYAAAPDSSVARLLPAVLKNANVPEDKIKKISVDISALYAGFLNKQYDGIEAINFDEVPHFNGEGHKVKCLNYSDYGVKMPGLGIVASLSTIKNKPDLVKRFVAATLKSYAYAFEHPDETADAVKKMENAKNTSVSIAQLKDFAALQPKPLGSMKESDWKDTVGYLTKYVGVENAPTDVSKYYTEEFLPK